MIRLRTLGQIELSADDGADVNALVAQPKRFALLCHLAIPKPGTMHRRDTLLGVFWSEGGRFPDGRATANWLLEPLRDYVPFQELIKPRGY